MLTKSTQKYFEELSMCYLSNLKIPGVLPFAAFNISKNNIYIHDNAKSNDIICLWCDIKNNPIKKIEPDVEGWNDD